MRSSRRLLRSAADATRFTAASPHAHSAPTPIRRAAAGTFSPSHAPQPKAANRNPGVSPNARPTTPNSRPQAPAPPPQPTETPAQKVARLRAARLAEKASQVSNWDKIVVTGREWADRAHRTVAWGLIAFTGIFPIFPSPLINPSPAIITFPPFRPVKLSRRTLSVLMDDLQSSPPV